MRMDGATNPSSALSDLPGLLPNRACRPCVNIKAKCVPLPGSEHKTCERCHRLGKSCITPQPKTRKRLVRRVNSRDRSSLPEHSSASAPVPSPQTHHFTLLQSTESVPSMYTPSAGSYPTETVPTPPLPSTGHILGTTKSISVPTRPDVSNVPDTSPKGRSQGVSSAFEISPEIGHSFIQPAHETLFEYFRDMMSSHFPFVVLTDETGKMRQERPFTYVACVMAAAHSDPTLQYRISRDTLRYLGDHMLLRGEKSFDLLQGLLIMINWYHVHRNGNPQLMNLVHLAKALLVDLGLNRRGGVANFHITPSNDTNRMLHGQQQDSNQHSLEERRACLGAYHVQARLAACYRRLDTMPWSEHIEDCCQVLQDMMERPSDVFAVAIVRLDHLVDRYRSIDGGPQKLTMPLPTYVKLISADLESFKQNLPLHLQHDAGLSLHIQSSQICLFERIINTDSNVSSHRVEALHACLVGVVEYFNSFMSQKLECFPCLAFLAWSTIAHAFDVLSKLSFLEVENWDLEYVRNNPGFIAISDATIETLSKAQAMENIRNPTSKSIRFKMSVQRVEMFKQWYLSRLDLEAKTRSERLEMNMESTMTGDDTNLGPLFSDLADIVWQDFTADWSHLDGTFNPSSWPQQNI